MAQEVLHRAPGNRIPGVPRGPRSGGVMRPSFVRTRFSSSPGRSWLRCCWSPHPRPHQRRPAPSCRFQSTERRTIGLTSPAQERVPRSPAPSRRRPASDSAEDGLPLPQRSASGIQEDQLQGCREVQPQAGQSPRRQVEIKYKGSSKYRAVVSATKTTKTHDHYSERVGLGLVGATYRKQVTAGLDPGATASSSGSRCASPSSAVWWW